MSDETTDKISEIIKRFLELEEKVEDIGFEFSVPACEKAVETEDNFERLMELQSQQLNRLNKNIEQTNTILGEISGSLVRGE